jgi:hypothetical protein
MHFCPKLMHNLNRGKKKPKMWAASVIFQIPAQSKQSPIGRQFAQSGHPATYVYFVLYFCCIISVGSLKHHLMDR